MRRMILPVAAFAVFGLAIAGCTALRGGKTIVKYDQQTAPITTKVQNSGTYGLFSTSDMTPKVRIQLNTNDTIGFQKLDNGEVVAVAGNEKIPLQADTTYYWQRM